jgi:hypothetical protein
MKKILAAALGALALGSTALVAPAEARPYARYNNHYNYNSRGHGDAVAAGIAGLAIGAIIGSAASRPSYGSSYSYGYSYGPGYGGYGPGYGYGGGYGYAPPRICRGSERVWDPYWRRYVYVERNYRC